MGKRERITEAGLVLERVRQFMQLGPEKGVQHVTLNGPPDTPTNYHVYAGFFPNKFPIEPGYALLGTHTTDAMPINKRVLAWPPPKIPGQESSPDRCIAEIALRAINEEACARNGMPSIVLGIGETRRTKEEVVTLFFVAGMSPQTALHTLQERIRLRLARLN